MGLEGLGSWRRHVSCGEGRGSELGKRGWVAGDEKVVVGVEGVVDWAYRDCAAGAVMVAVLGKGADIW